LIALHQNKRNPRIHTYKGLSEKLTEIKPNIIILENDPISLLALQLGLWAKRNNTKLLCLTNDNVSRTLVNSYNKQGIKGLLYSILLQTVNFITQPLVHHLFVISNAGLQEFTELGYANKLTKIPLGFDTNIFYYNEQKRLIKRKELNIENDFVIAYFGRMKFQKGIHILIEALALLKNHSWKFMLDYFEEGGDNYQNYLRELIKKYDLENRLIFVHASHLEVADYMRAADVIVVPSLETKHFIEQYGRVVPESMACGTLTIVSNTGALPELQNNIGLKFKQGDINDLYEKLIHIMRLTDSEKQDLRIKSAEYAQKKLSIKSQAELMAPYLQR
ncbi:MAG: glycosyltransferase family 4 protein, partial [Bacteroidia bacterium]